MGTGVLPQQQVAPDCASPQDIGDIRLCNATHSAHALASVPSYKFADEPPAARPCRDLKVLAITKQKAIRKQAPCSLGHAAPR